MPVNPGRLELKRSRTKAPSRSARARCWHRRQLARCSSCASDRPFPVWVQNPRPEIGLRGLIVDEFSCVRLRTGENSRLRCADQFRDLLVAELWHGVYSRSTQIASGFFATLGNWRIARALGSPGRLGQAADQSRPALSAGSASQRSISLLGQLPVSNRIDTRPSR